jgi:hypothetical protein
MGSGQGKIRTLIEENLLPIPWWFVAAGIASTAGMLLQFLALFHAETWIVALI